MRYHDLDLNGHVNHIRYVERLLDDLPLDFYAAYRPKGLVVQYQAEAVYGDRIITRHAALEDGRIGHALYRERDGKGICRGLTVWEKKT